MRVLVTGAGGFLGFEIVKMLRQRGLSVRSLSRQSYPKLQALGVDHLCGDLADLSKVRQAVEGCDVVFHVAAKAGIWGKWSEYYQANVVGTQNILQACRDCRTPRLIFTSSPSVTFAGVDQNGVSNNEPYSSKFLAYYPYSKAIAEKLVLESNSDSLLTIALRPHLIWGPDDPHLIPRLVARAKKGKLRKIGSADKLVDTVFVENAALAHLCALDRLQKGASCAGKAYFVSQGEPEPLWSFINKILSVYGLPPVTRSVPQWLAVRVGGILETLYSLLPLSGEPPMTRFVALQLSTAHWFDTTPIREDLGFVPTITTAQGLERLRQAIT